MKRVTAKYKMPAYSLYMFTGYLVNTMRKDKDYFALRGVSEADIDALKALQLAFGDVDLSEISAPAVTIEVEAKDKQRSAVYKEALYVRGIFQQAFGIHSEQYKRIKSARFGRASDNVFVSLMYDLARIAEEMSAELFPVGLTQAMIDSIRSGTELLEEKIDAVADIKTARKENTDYRVEKGNELYGFVQKYTTIGKLLAAEYPAVMRDNYLIYPFKKRKKRSGGSETPADVS